MERQLKTLGAVGIITVADLAAFTESTAATIITHLEKHNIKILKLSKNHTAWLVRLEDLRYGNEILSIKT